MRSIWQQLRGLAQGVAALPHHVVTAVRAWTNGVQNRMRREGQRVRARVQREYARLQPHIVRHYTLSPTYLRNLLTGALFPTIIVGAMWFFDLFGTFWLAALWIVLTVIHMWGPVHVGRGYYLLLEKNNRRWTAVALVAICLTIATIFSPWGASPLERARYDDYVARQEFLADYNIDQPWQRLRNWAFTDSGFVPDRALSQDEWWTWQRKAGVAEVTKPAPPTWTIFWRRFWAMIASWVFLLCYTVIAFKDEVHRSLARARERWVERRQAGQEHRAREEHEPRPGGEAKQEPTKARSVRGLLPHGWSQALFVFLADLIGDIILHRRPS